MARQFASNVFLVMMGHYVLLGNAFVLSNAPVHTLLSPPTTIHPAGLAGSPGRFRTVGVRSRIPAVRDLARTNVRMSLSSSNKKFPSPSWQVTACCVVGVALTVYALRVESLAKVSQDFKAGCDFGSWASCTRVSRSVYGRGLGLIDPHGPLAFLSLSNALYGMLYYLFMLLLQLPSLFPVPRFRALALLASSVSLFTSLYLAIILFFVLKDVCIVCISCYAVNAALFFFAWRDYQRMLKALRGGA